MLWCGILYIILIDSDQDADGKDVNIMLVGPKYSCKKVPKQHKAQMNIEAYHNVELRTNDKSNATTNIGK
jgi:hypothetical protein